MICESELDDVSSPATYDWGSDTGSDKHDFAYDDVDSRATVSRTGSSTQYYSVNSLNQYLEIDTVSGLQSADRTYDLNGNLKTTEAGASYSYDYKNRLVQALKTDDYRVSFEYDYFGRRTYKKYEDCDPTPKNWTGEMIVFS